MINSFSDYLHDTTPLVALVIAMTLSMLVIPVVWRFAARFGMIDQPDVRKVHTHSIPRVGGLGILIGAILSIIAMLDIGQQELAFLIGAGVIFIFGIWDDTRQVGPYTKFIGQFIAVAVVVFYGDIWIRHLPFTDIEGVSPWIGIPFTFFAIIGMTNAVNTSDGLDGLAAGESLLSLIVIAFLAYIAGGVKASVIATSCIGGLFGFLRYNTHPADIFMGDTGSQFLGYALGFLAVVVTQDVHPSLSPALTLLFLGLPVIDLLAVMTMRIRKGRSPFRADQTHIHHRILNLGFDHYETVVIIYTIQTLLVISAIFLRYQSDLLIILVYAFTAVVIFGLLSYAERTGWHATHKPIRSLTSTVLYVRQHRIDLTRIALRIVGISIPLYLISTALFVETVPRDFGMIAAVFTSVMLVDLFYHREKNGISLRGGIYIIAIFSVYLAVHSARLSSIPVFDIFYYGLLALCIGIVVRYATDKKFQTSPMDYLIVFGVLAIAVFGGRYLEIKDIGILIVKSMIMLYGCELLYTRTSRNWSCLNISALIAMATIGIRGLIG